MNTHLLQDALGSVSIVRNFYVYTEIDSTMDQARRLVSSAGSGQFHGNLLLADYQSAGKGRHGRRWLSPPGMSLLATLILSRAELPGPADEVQLSRLASVVPVSIVRAIMKQVPSARIKYPNDIVAGSRKLAGSLIDVCGEFVFIGFGVNCNHNLDELPAETRLPASSLFLETGKVISRELLLKSILIELESLLTPATFAGASEEMNNLCESLGRELCLDIGNEIVTGIATAITADGTLQLQSSDGNRIVYSTQVVRTWFPNQPGE